MPLPQPQLSPPAALVVAHPGHELRVHGWLERARPTVFVLTDGSGHGRGSRLGSTERLLRATGATPGAVFGRFSDREIYRLLLEGETGILAELARELAAALVALKVQVVAADALEGYNPSHDLCRVLTDAAVALVAQRSGLTPTRYEFPLSGPSGAGLEAAGALRLTLDDAALTRKLAAAHAYPEMADEVERALAGHGEEGFREECLRPVDPALTIEERAGSPPFYETYGERQVAAGYYPRVLRLREHFLPAAQALAALPAEGRSPRAIPAPGLRRESS
jgi:hypothetical protein